MKTTQKKAVSAYGTIAKLSKQPMNSFAAYKLFRMKKALAVSVEFVGEQEQRFVAESGGTINEIGQINFPNTEASAKYLEKHRELDEMECEVNVEKMTFTIKELPDLSVADMESLDEFIEWKE